MTDNSRLKICAIGAVYKNDKSEYLYKALKSIENQTFKVDSVYVVVDGEIGSDLEQVLNQFSNLVKLHRLKKAIGLGSALNELLISKIYGKYDFGIRFDADDININDRFKILVETSIENNLDLCGSYVQEFDDNLINVGLRKTPLSFRQMNLLKNIINPFNHPSVIYRIDILEKVGGYEDCPYHEDWLLWLKFLKNTHKVKNIANPLVLFRLNEGTFKRRFNSSFNKFERAFYAKALKNKLMNPAFGILGLLLRQTTRLFGMSFYKYIYRRLRNI